MKFKAMKFNIGKGNEEVNKTVEKTLFNAGYKWYDCIPDAQRATEPFLYTYVDGVITCGSDEAYFDEHEHLEIDIEWMKPTALSKLINVGDEIFEEEWLIDFIAESRKLIANVKSMRESENEH